MTGISARDLFWFAVGLLGALAAVFVLSPWIGEAGRSVRGNWRLLRWPLGGALALTIGALSVYAYLGSPNMPRTPSMAAAPTSLANAGSMDAMRARLEQRLAAQGGSNADWNLLAQTYDFLGLRADAERARTQHLLSPAAGSTAGASPATETGSAAGPVTAAAATTAAQPPSTPPPAALRADAQSARRAGDYQKAVRDFAQLAAAGALDAQGWADYADAAASLNGGQLAGEPEGFISAALAQDPANEKALWLEASLQHQTGRYQAAISTWQALLRQAPSGSSDARIFAANLLEDEGLAGRSGSSQSSTPSTSQTPAASAAAIVGDVTLRVASTESPPAGTTLFVIARAVDSPGPPVAVLRVGTGNWPLHFQLDDSLAMLPGRTLSSAGSVNVQARISRSGAALPAAGDLESSATRVDPRDARPLHLVIDQVVR